MKRSSSELKSIAKGKLLGNYSIPMGAVIIFFVITFIITFFSTFSRNVQPVFEFLQK